MQTHGVLMDDEIEVALHYDIDVKVAKMPEVQKSALDVAENVAQIARDTAPSVTGDYKAGIKAQQTKSGARVFASDYKSAWIEFGAPNRNQPARWILRRAAESAGLKFKKRRG
jgi:hypothetical protein